jgi:hypothetical protein
MCELTGQKYEGFSFELRPNPPAPFKKKVSFTCESFGERFLAEQRRPVLARCERGTRRKRLPINRAKTKVIRKNFTASIASFHRSLLVRFGREQRRGELR